MDLSLPPLFHRDGLAMALFTGPWGGIKDGTYPQLSQGEALPRHLKSGERKRALGSLSETQLEAGTII